MFGLANTCKVLRGYPPAVKEQVACASTEPGDSPVPSRTGESSELGEVFDQANLLGLCWCLPRVKVIGVRAR